MLQIFANIYEESSEMLQHLRAMMDDVDQLEDDHLAHQVRIAWFAAARIFNCAGLPFADQDDGLVEEGYETANEEPTDEEDDDQDAADDDDDDQDDQDANEEDEAGV